MTRLAHIRETLVLGACVAILLAIVIGTILSLVLWESASLYP